MPRLVQKARRWNRWPVVLPLYDGRQCPDCSAVVVGKAGQRHHRAWHVARTEYDSAAAQALALIGRQAGVKVTMTDPEDAPDGHWDDEDDDQDDDEDPVDYADRMGRKLR